MSSLVTNITVEGNPTPQRIQISPPENINFAIKFDVIKEFLQKNGITNFALIEDLGDPIDREKIYEKARKFTVPVLCFKNKGEESLRMIRGWHLSQQLTQTLTLKPYKKQDSETSQRDIMPIKACSISIISLLSAIMSVDDVGSLRRCTLGKRIR